MPKADAKPPDERDENVFQAHKYHRDYIPRPVDRPTDAPPGSRRKIKVLRERLLCGVELWHQRDNRRVTRDPYLQMNFTLDRF
jgi:hypothetical protein